MMELINLLTKMKDQEVFIDVGTSLQRGRFLGFIPGITKKVRASCYYNPNNLDPNTYAFTRTPLRFEFYRLNNQLNIATK